MKVIFIENAAAAVSCSASPYDSGGLTLGSGTTGKLGRAWVGAWVSVRVDAW